MRYTQIKPMKHTFRLYFYEYDLDDQEFRLYYFEDYEDLASVKQRQVEFNNAS